ncbi:MAG: hypothetical protein AB7F64_03930 [Gammaproteobacteria bacterium]
MCKKTNTETQQEEETSYNNPLVCAKPRRKVSSHKIFRSFEQGGPLRRRSSTSSGGSLKLKM